MKQKFPMLKLKNRPDSNYDSYNISSSTINMVLQKFCVQCNKVDIWVSVMFIWTVWTPSFPLLWILFLPFANKSIFNPPSISNLILMSLAADDQLFVNHSLLLCVKYANGGVWHETDIREGGFFKLKIQPQVWNFISLQNVDSLLFCRVSIHFLQHWGPKGID